MRWILALLAATMMTLPGCAYLESIFKPEAPSSEAPASVPASPPPAMRPLPLLPPQLSEAEERRLRDETTRAIAEAERAAQAVRADRLQPAESETLASIQSFLRQARQALTDRDYERAGTLARKAGTLAKDLRGGAR